MEDKLSFKDAFLCPNLKCRTILKISDDIFKMYFNSDKMSCPACKSDLNLWDTVNSQFDLSIFGWHYAFLGCQCNFKEIILKKDEIYILDLSDEIGAGKILYINYSPFNDGLFPLQIHSNIPNLSVIPSVINLYPRPLKAECKDTKVQICYWFAPKDVYDDLSIMLLLDAFQNFYEEDSKHMAISAQSAVEILSFIFFEKMLESASIPSYKVKDFLENRATFSPQLFTLLPLLSNKLGFAMLNDKIINGLKLLVSYRNDMIHRGETKIHINQTQSKIMLLSAFFAVKYFQIIHGISFV